MNTDASFCRSRFVTLILAIISTATAPMTAQVITSCAPQAERGLAGDSSGWNFTVHGYGVSLGDASPIRGIRLGLHDTGVYSVDGMSLTLWGDGDCALSRVRGLAIGLVGPNAGEIQGLAVGGVVRSNVSTTGLTAGVATEAGGWQRGITVAGVFAHAGHGMLGITVSGIATVSEGSLIGVSMAPIAVMTGHATGVTLAGGVVTADSGLSGITVGGLAIQADGDARWITASALGAIVGGSARGLSLGGLWLSAGKSMTGFNASGLVLRAGGGARWVTLTPGVLTARGAVEGLGIAGLHLDAESGRGVIISASNRLAGLQSGIAIGLINDVGDLHGVQIGLLNRVRNRRGAGRLLPLLQVGR